MKSETIPLANGAPGSTYVLPASGSAFQASSFTTTVPPSSFSSYTVAPASTLPPTSLSTFGSSSVLPASTLPSQPYYRGEITGWPRISSTFHDARSYISENYHRAYPTYRSKFLGHTEVIQPSSFEVPAATTTTSYPRVSRVMDGARTFVTESVRTVTSPPLSPLSPSRQVVSAPIPSDVKRISETNERELIDMFPRLDPMLVSYVWRQTPDGVGRVEKCIETLMRYQEKEDRKISKQTLKSKISQMPPGALKKKLPLIAGGAVGVLILLWILSSFLFGGGGKAGAGEILCSKTTTPSECDAQGCIYNRAQSKCYLPEPDDLVNSQTFAFPYKLMFIGDDDVGKTTLINSFMKAFGGKESLSTKEETRAKKFQRLAMGQIELYDTPGLDLRHDSQDTAFTLRRFASGVQLGENIDKDWTRWSADRSNAINRMVIVLDVREGMKFGFLWNSLNTDAIDQWRRFFERFGALGTAPPVVVINTFGKKASVIQPLIDELARVVPQRHLFAINAKKVAPLELSKFLFGVLRDARMLPLRHVPGYSGFAGGRYGYGYGGLGYGSGEL